MIAAKTSIPPLTYTPITCQYRVERSARWDTGWRTLPFALFETPSGGSWVLETESGSCTVPDGKALAVMPGTPHRLISKGSFRSTWVYAQWELEGVALKAEPGARVLSNDFAVTIQDLARDLEGSSRELDTLIRLNTAALRLLEAVRSEFSIRQVADARIAKVITYARDHFHRPISRAEMASIAGLSEARFHELFNEVTGEAPLRHIHRLRLQKSMAMLLNTSEPIGEVANRCGFESPYYFSRFFRKHAGCSPTQFREGSEQT